jgi:hypothetical protein
MTLLSKWEGVEQDDGDLNRKFSGTFVLARIDKGEPVTVQVREIGGRMVYCQLQNSRTHVPTNTFDIVNPLPAPGVYTTDKGAIALVRRVPARQWSEGLCLANTAILINGDIKLNGLGFEVAAQLFSEQQSTSLNEGLKAIKPGECLRLTNRCWLKADKVGGHTSLFRDRTRIGSWALGEYFSVSASKLLAEEVKDELNFHA